MHGTGAGLADPLALEPGCPLDVVGVRGSGATLARINLLRRKDNLAGKKLVIWCFSARECTEAAGGWRLVPVIGKK
jgi:alginate O-acetyltransferase complex protein AlgJ